MSYKMKKELVRNIRNYFIKKYYNLKYWLGKREHLQYDYHKRLIYLTKTLLAFIISIIGFIIAYSNAKEFNQIDLWIIKLGGVLIIISIFFIIKFGWRFFKEITNIIKRQKNWIKCILIILVLILLWQGYANKDSILRPASDFYNKTNLSLFNPISITDANSFFTIPKIDNNWTNNFMSSVNAERIRRGLYPLKESNELNQIAYSRFNKMMENPLISHYGARESNIGEVVFYPEGSTEQEYIHSIQQEAPLHWSLLMDPGFSIYGYYIGEGPAVKITDYCPITEIPGPNINVQEFFNSYGCTTQVEEAIWLVIELA